MQDIDVTNLTRLEKRILSFIESHIANGGESPTLSQIGEACQLKSVGTIHRYVRSIEGKGFLERKPNKWRGISLDELRKRCAKSNVNVFPALKDVDFSSGAKRPAEILGTSRKT